jgi:acetolactate synthase-1/2/3 large subunit
VRAHPPAERPEGFFIKGSVGKTVPKQKSTRTPVTGAQAVMMALEHQGVEVVFGIPGGASLPLYDWMRESRIRHILARHEQGAGHMAEGYAQATGKVGVAFATSGPGATNLVTPLQDALMDSIPVVAITAQVSSAVIGNDAFQEADIGGLAMHCTKHSYLVIDPDAIVDTIAEAFHIASSGRPGPVLVDIPTDVLKASTHFHEPGPVSLPGYRPTRRGHPLQVRRAVEMIREAQRPVLYAGGGVIKAGASAELLRLAEATSMPVVTTLNARGAFPDGHPLALGMPGMHGTYTAITAMQKADLLVTIGARFDDRVTGDPNTFAVGAKVIHADVDPAEIGKVRRADVPIVGDAREVILQMLAEIDKEGGAETMPARGEWLETLRSWQRDFPLNYQQSPDGPLKAQFVIEKFYEATGGDAVVVTGVGLHQMWSSQFWKFSRPRTFITSGGLGTMGFAVPAAIGAKAGRPEATVIAFDGDGGFQMTFRELITASIEEIPVKIVVLNNGTYGMVRQWQTLFYGGRYSGIDLTDHTPDYVKLAEAMGCVGLRAQSPDEVAGVVAETLATNDKPVVAEFKVDPEEMVFPMVPAGGSNDAVMLGPGGGA